MFIDLFKSTETEVALEDFTYENRDILEAISQHLEETTFNGLSVSPCYKMVDHIVHFMI